ncbi:hypothetical protein Scep_001065 [Stephania cephalantha]|uniref:Uncharacterized protein n=1 Tax=Stephania cephalantha TaxID=152367 RepID=A0AAP0LB19_9MAGN
MQFLMGLNDIYDHVRNQILVMDPLPNINKAYSMILRVEKQREVNINFAPALETTMAVRNGHVKQFHKWDSKKFVNKDDLVFEFCKRKRHIKDNCFKLHGIPEWYKNNKDRKPLGD